MKLPSIDSWIYNPIEMLNDRTSLVIHGKSLQILNFGDILLGLSTLNRDVFNAEALGGALLKTEDQLSWFLNNSTIRDCVFRSICPTEALILEPPSGHPWQDQF